MPSTPQLTFAQLMEIRGAAEKMLGNKTSLPPIHKDLMQYWTTAEAKAFYESGGREPEQPIDRPLSLIFSHQKTGRLGRAKSRVPNTALQIP